MGEDAPSCCFQLAYLGVTNALAMLRLLPMSDRAKDVEILTLRHQITVLQRQQHGEKVRFTPADRALLAALLHRLPLRRAAPDPAAGPPGDRAPLAPRPARPPARSALAPQAHRATTDGAVDPRAGPAPGP